LYAIGLVPARSKIAFWNALVREIAFRTLATQPAPSLLARRLFGPGGAAGVRLKAKAGGYTPQRREEEIQFQEQLRDEIQFRHEPGTSRNFSVYPNSNH